MEEFYMDDEAILAFKNSLNDIWSELDSAYISGRLLDNRIKDEQLWTGDAGKTFQAYFDLLLQYHHVFVKTNLYDNPIKQADEVLQELMNHIDSFYDEFQEYKDLRGRL